MELIKTIVITTFILFCMGVFIKWRYFDKYCRTWKPTDYDLLKEGDKVRLINTADHLANAYNIDKHKVYKWEVLEVDNYIFMCGKAKCGGKVYHSIDCNSAKQYLIEVWR